MEGRRETYSRGWEDGIKGFYDAGWQKQGRAHNSRTGEALWWAKKQENVLIMGPKFVRRKCFEAEKRGVDPVPHDCRIDRC